ncbi:MAG TPA: hypothetical protein VNN25_23675 [Thermoanaerobaculia bacterium]|nr:hypothetical protein [Thermoanaerobaculia bacterium]
MNCIEWVVVGRELFRDDDCGVGQIPGVQRVALEGIVGGLG